MGYHVFPGGKFSGDYLVADMDDIIEVQKLAKLPEKLELHRIREIIVANTGKHEFLKRRLRPSHIQDQIDAFFGNSDAKVDS